MLDNLIHYIMIIMQVMDGDQVKFRCHVQGNPMPEISWKHNGKLVFDNPDVRTVYARETGEAVLMILEAFPQDTGVYECIAVNKYGRAVSVTNLTVEGKSVSLCNVIFQVIMVMKKKKSSFLSRVHEVLATSFS